MIGKKIKFYEELEKESDMERILCLSLIFHGNLFLPNAHRVEFQGKPKNEETISPSHSFDFITSQYKSNVFSIIFELCQLNATQGIRRSSKLIEISSSSAINYGRFRFSPPSS